MRAVVSHELLPKGLELESLSLETGHVSICAQSGASRGTCPLCGHGSSRVHSRYVRTVSDLPWHGICVTFKIRARRFFCDEASCERKIFRERLPPPSARKICSSRKTLRQRRSGWREEDILRALGGGSRSRPKDRSAGGGLARDRPRTRRQGGRQAGRGVGHRGRSRHLAEEDQGRTSPGGREGKGSRRGRLRLQEGQHLRHDPRKSRRP